MFVCLQESDVTNARPHCLIMSSQVGSMTRDTVHSDWLFQASDWSTMKLRVVTRLWLTSWDLCVFGHWYYNYCTVSDFTTVLVYVVIFVCVSCIARVTGVCTVWPGNSNFSSLQIGLPQITKSRALLTLYTAVKVMWCRGCISSGVDKQGA